jgi:aryl-alcohol dehydrogenase-like predicted oxidoreductase
VEYRNLGRSGLRVSSIGLGCNNFGSRIDLEATRAVVDTAIDLGITLFDTADIYGGDSQGGRGRSETFLGEILGERRHRIVLATKFGLPMEEGVRPGASRRAVVSGCEASLRRLRTDWIDLYQLHAPDPLTPIEETLRALEDLMRAGKIRYAGSCNLAAWQIVEAHWTARQQLFQGFVACQDELSLIVRDAEREILPAAEACGIGVLPFFPLAGGLLTGKYRRGQPMPPGARLTTIAPLARRYLTPRNWDVAEALIGFAEARGRTILELGFSWLLSRKGVASVIAGAIAPEQLAQNVLAGDWRLTQSELAEIDRITLNGSAAG